MTILTAPLRANTTHDRSRGQPRSYAGTGHVLRFIVRRDRVRAPVWIVAVVGVVVASTASVIDLYSTPDDLASYATVVRADAALAAITGPGYGLDDPSQAAIVMNEMSMFTLVGVALILVFMVIRHTRAEEETGRAELVRSAPVGRHAALVAAMVWVGAIAVTIAVFVTLGMLLWLPFVGSLAFGAAIAALGLVSVGVAAVTAQIASTARAANSIAGALLGLAFLVRAVGDLGNGWLSWLSPIGWAQGIRAYAHERWWVLVPLLVLATSSMAGAVALSARRDLGHGLLAQRQGVPSAGPRLSSPLGLAVRLQRVSVISWAIGIGILGLFMGLVADQANALADNEAVAQILSQAGSGTLTESFLATIMLMNALLASGFFVSSTLRLRSEERDLRVSPILATPVSRREWLWSHPTVAILGGTGVMLFGGLLTGLGDAVGVGDSKAIVPLIAAAFAWLPALFVMVAIPVALIGVAPRLAPLVWLVVAHATIVGILGRTLGMAQWMRDLSPFEHTPQLPAQGFDIVPIAAQLAVAAALIAIGTVGIRHRDLD